MLSTITIEFCCAIYKIRTSCRLELRTYYVVGRAGGKGKKIER